MLRDQPIEPQEATAVAPAACDFQHRQLAAQIAEADRAAVAHAIPTPPAPRAFGGTTLSGPTAIRSPADPVLAPRHHCGARSLAAPNLALAAAAVRRRAGRLQ